MSGKTPREAFVEAMRDLWDGDDIKSAREDRYEAACDAFAEILQEDPAKLRKDCGL